MNTKQTSLGVERRLVTLPSNSSRSYDHSFVSQSWNSFQKLRGHKTTKREARREVKERKIIANRPASQSSAGFFLQRQSEQSNGSNATHSKPTQGERKTTDVKNDTRWARNWANHRAHQTVLTGNHPMERLSQRSRRCDTQSTEKTNVPHTMSSARSRPIEMDAKAAELFNRIRSIYVNEEEHNRRLQRIRERMDDFQKESIKKEVNISIHEFNKKLKEDEQNRKELRRVREKFLETKKQRLRRMHVSRNALEAPTISRLAYGLPREGKEFSMALSSKKTMEEIKGLWRMAFIRQQCIDSFIDKVFQTRQELPDVTVKKRSKSLIANDEHPLSGAHLVRVTKEHLQEVEENETSDITRLAKLQTEMLDTYESLSSEGDNSEQ